MLARAVIVLVCVCVWCVSQEQEPHGPSELLRRRRLLGCRSRKKKWALEEFDMLVGQGKAHTNFDLGTEDHVQKKMEAKHLFQ